MGIVRLKVEKVRNLREVELVPVPGLNRVGGVNGSGKSSLLEAIEILGTGKSFRAGELASVVTRGEKALEVYGELQEEGEGHRLGIRRGTDGAGEVRIDGRGGRGLAELARTLPLVTLSAGSERVIEGGPGERRRIVDWGVFHVEQNFGARWREARRVLIQRNAALKGKASEAELREWDRLWLEASDSLERSRARFTDSLAEKLPEVGEGEALPAGLGPLSVRYRKGWPDSAGEDRAVWLSAQRSRERAAGTTLFGAHRGDLFIAVAGEPARYRLSRGQQKSAVFALRVAQVRLLLAGGVCRPVVLIDDLGAELDRHSVEWVLGEFAGLGLQAFVTGVEADQYPTDGWSTHTLFHVEQGRISQVV